MQIKKNILSSYFQISIITSIALGTLTACDNSSLGSNFNQATPAAHASKKVGGGNYYLMTMGSGYDSSTQTATSDETCLANGTFDNVYIGNPQGLINFNHSQSMGALETALNVHVSGKYGGDRFGTSVEAQFANDSKDTSYTTNLIYLYEYSGKAVFKNGSLGIGMGALNPVAESMELTSPTKFRTMCGDNFVSQMDAGAVLAVRLSLQFNSHMDQQKFMSSMGVNVGLSNVMTSIQSALAQSNTNANLVLSAIQLGGQPQQLNNLFGSPDSNGIYPYLNCNTQNSLSGGNACNLMISNIIAYAQTMNGQLSNPDGSLNLERLFYNNPSITSYANLGIAMQGAPDPSADILNAMQELTTQYDKTLYDYAFTSHYLDVMSRYLDSATKENLRDAAQRLNEQINDVFLMPAYDVADCYKGYVSTECLQIRDNVEEALVPYALSAQESTLVSYLENNSYEARLLVYKGGNGNDPKESYGISDQPCVFAPISSNTTMRYAINCDDKWMKTSSPLGVSIIKDFGGSGVDVRDLSYFSTSPKNGLSESITYEDSNLPVDMAYDNYFHSKVVTIHTPEINIESGFLGMTQLYENPM